MAPVNGGAQKKKLAVFVVGRVCVCLGGGCMRVCM